MTQTECPVALAVPLLLLSVCACAEVGLVTWLHPQAAELTPCFAPGNDLVGSLTGFTQDPAEPETVRAKLGDYIEQTRKLLGTRAGTAGGTATTIEAAGR